MFILTHSSLVTCLQHSLRRPKITQARSHSNHIHISPYHFLCLQQSPSALKHLIRHRTFQTLKTKNPESVTSVNFFAIWVTDQFVPTILAIVHPVFRRPTSRNSFYSRPEPKLLAKPYGSFANVPVPPPTTTHAKMTKMTSAKCSTVFPVLERESSRHRRVHSLHLLRALGHNSREFGFSAQLTCHCQLLLFNLDKQ